MSWDIGTISVISSGIIAVSSILFPLVFNLISDFLRWKRETKASETQKIDDATVALLENLSIYRSGNIHEATQRPNSETFSKLLSRYYLWERLVWIKCKKVEQEKIKKLRENIENGNQKSFYEDGPKLVNEILELSHIAGNRI